MAAVSLEPHQHLYSNTAAANPGSLLPGQIAVNQRDRKLYFPDENGAVKQFPSKDGWQTYVPVVTLVGGTGAFAVLSNTNGFFQVVEPLRMVFLTMMTTVTDKGTAVGGKVGFTFPTSYPMTSDLLGVLAGRENGVSGKMLHAWFDPTHAYVGNYDDTPAHASNGAIIKVSGWYRY